MALTIDATPKSPTANSYATLAEANAYHEARGFNSEWTSASDTQKNAALAWATRLMERLSYKGSVLDLAQALRWPRAFVFDLDWREYDRNVVPQCVKDAQAELALYLLKEDRTEDQGSVGLSEVQVGPLGVKFNTNPGSTRVDILPASVKQLLLPVMEGGGPMARVVRS